MLSYWEVAIQNRTSNSSKGRTGSCILKRTCKCISKRTSLLNPRRRGRSLYGTMYTGLLKDCLRSWGVYGLKLISMGLRICGLSSQVAWAGEGRLGSLITTLIYAGMLSCHFCRTPTACSPSKCKPKVNLSSPRGLKSHGLRKSTSRIRWSFYRESLTSESGLWWPHGTRWKYTIIPTAMCVSRLTITTRRERTTYSAT